MQILKPKRRKRVLRISPFARYEIEKLTDGVGWPIVEKALVLSAEGFLDSPYMKRSSWFREQRLHLYPAIQVKKPEQEPAVPLLALERSADGWTLRSPVEVTLPESYPELRLIEETKVEFLIG